MKKFMATLALSLLPMLSTSVYAGPPATVADLSWMTGNWVGH